MEESYVQYSNKDFDAFMCEKFPVIFQERKHGIEESCMSWGFEIGSGWHNLVYNLCVKLDTISSLWNFEIVATQVKEKYGTLRFYYTCYFKNQESEKNKIIEEIVEDVVGYAEVVSGRTCDVCGNYGSLNSSGWISARCKKHRS